MFHVEFSGSFFCAVLGVVCYVIGMFMLLLDESARPPPDLKARLALIRRQRLQKMKEDEAKLTFRPLDETKYLQANAGKQVCLSATHPTCRNSRLKGAVPLQFMSGVALHDTTLETGSFRIQM